MLLRTYIFIGILIICSASVKGQLCFPVKNGYAYVQPVNRGIASREDRRDQRHSVNHLIYIQSKSDNVTVKHVWINGELHAAELKEVKAPVSIGSPTNKSESVVLVPASKRKTYQLLIVALPQYNPMPVLPAKYAKSPVVIQLQYKKKNKYLAIREVKQLDVMALY